jgi:hypothetical protein
MDALEMSLVVFDYVFVIPIRSSAIFFFFSYDYLGFWRFPPVCTVNYAVTLVLVIISGGSVSDSLGAKSHLLDVFVLLADINSPLFDYK